MTDRAKRFLEHLKREIELLNACDACHALVKGPPINVGGIVVYACQPCAQELA